MYFNDTIYGVWGDSNGKVWVCGRATSPGTSTLLMRDGSVWKEETIQGQTLYSIWGTSAGDIWAVGSSGTIIHRDASGWNKATSPAPTTVALRGVHGQSSSDAMAVGESGTVLKLDPAGWNPLPLMGASTEELTAVYLDSGGDYVITSKLGRIHHYNGGALHTKPLQSTPVYAVWGSSASDIWVSGDHILLHYDDRL